MPIGHGYLTSQYCKTAAAFRYVRSVSEGFICQCESVLTFGTQRSVLPSAPTPHPARTRRFHPIDRLDRYLYLGRHSFQQTSTHLLQFLHVLECLLVHALLQLWISPHKERECCVRQKAQLTEISVRYTRTRGDRRHVRERCTQIEGGASN